MLASLLLVTLGRDWAFLSDVVLSLLSAHIQRCCLLQNQNNVKKIFTKFYFNYFYNFQQPPLLFRHSESLVEKLFQHWLCISLLPWLQSEEGGPARPLFLLYRALKALTEKAKI